MQQYATPICHGEQRHLDIGEVELFTTVVILIAEPGLGIVDRLVLTVLGQLFVTQITFDGIGSPFGSVSPRSTVLIWQMTVSKRLASTQDSSRHELVITCRFHQNEMN